MCLFSLSIPQYLRYCFHAAMYKKWKGFLTRGQELEVTRRLKGYEDIEGSSPSDATLP